MKKISHIFLLIALLLLTACNAIQEEDNITPTTEESQPMEETAETPTTSGEIGLVKSDAAREMAPEVNPQDVDAIVKDNTTFALKFFDQIRPGDGNIIYSPISLSLALSMTLAGAETSTENAMLEALQFDLPEEIVHPAFNALLIAIEDSEKDLPEEVHGNKFQLKTIVIPAKAGIHECRNPLGYKKSRFMYSAGRVYPNGTRARRA